MFTHNEEGPTTTERVREKLLSKFDKSDLMLSKLSSDDEDESVINTHHILSPKDRERRTSNISTNGPQGRPSKTDSSIIETDTSVLAINKKIDEMKKKTTGNKFRK